MIEPLSRSPLLVTLLSSMLVSAPAQTAAPAPQTTTPAVPATTAPATTTNRQVQGHIQTPPQLAMPHTWEPFGAYRSSTVPEPQLTNSPRLDQLIREGKLY